MELVLESGVPSVEHIENVLHRLDDDQLEPVLEKLQQSDLPNLWKPKAGDFHHVDALPYLGTGKLDLKQINALATGFATSV